MSFKDLLVFVDTLPGGDQRLDLAVALARQHEAHLTAVHVVRPPEIPGAPGRVYFETILETALEQPERDVATLEESFRERLRRDGLLGEWRVIRDDSRHQPAVHARYADLVIAGQVREHSRAAGPGAIMPAELAILSGRPVIVAPDTSFPPTVGGNLLIAWKPTREAVRAIAEAMPLLRRAERVTLLSVNPHVGATEHGEQPGADLARHLARHGVEIVVETAVAHDVGVADAVLSRAAQAGADLIVMGAGGHSRLHEMIFGGATVDMLEQARIPLLIAH